MSSLSPPLPTSARLLSAVTGKRCLITVGTTNFDSLIRALDQPQAAPICARKVSSEVRVEAHQLFDLLLLADAGRMFKYRACNAVGAGALGWCRIHVSTFQRAAVKSAYLAKQFVYK